MDDLTRKLLQGDFRALARLITMAENLDTQVWKILSENYSKLGRAHVVGITGPPGAGKSTLIDKLVNYLSNGKNRIGILAIDPISPFSRGALLGDRIRLGSHFNNPNVYIRSVSTRGKLGGLSLATREATHLMDLCGCDWIFVETVGVGQSEIDVGSIADVTMVVLVPESGDEIQTLKAGILEIADLFVVNKSDREGAPEVVNALIELISISQTRAEVVSTSVSDLKSIEKLGDALKTRLGDAEFLNKRRKDRSRIETLELVQSWVIQKTRDWVRGVSTTGQNPYEFAMRFSQTWKSPNNREGKS